DRTFAQHDEDTLARRALELLDERNDLGNAVEDVAADDQVRGRDLGVLPGARDDGQVGQRRQVGTHALGRLHRGDPLELLRQRHRVPAGAGADVDQRLAVRGYPAPLEFPPSEAALLSRYFTNLDRPVFALRNLPEVVKGALFSRYSRTEKSLRRVLLDEFINDPESGFAGIVASHVFGVG